MADKTLPGSYISVANFSAAATGIDPNMLPAGELARIIFRASRAADGICKQVLYSTEDTVQLLEDRSPEGYAIDLSDGSLKFFPRRFPIRSITSLKQFFASADVPAAITAAWVHIDSSGTWGWVEGIWAPYKHRYPAMYLELAYVNGWLATTLQAQAASGQNQLTLVPQMGQTSVKGIYAGQVLEIQDGVPELVTVQSVAGNAVTLTGNLASTHIADTFVVEPQFNELSFANVQQAVLNLVSHFIKEDKGVAPLVLKDDRVEPRAPGTPAMNLYEEAKELLEPFKVNF